MSYRILDWLSIHAPMRLWMRLPNTWRRRWAREWIASMQIRHTRRIVRIAEELAEHERPTQ